MKLLFLDTETTGNEVKKDRLVEVCFKSTESNEIECELFKPPLPMSVKSMSVTHITNKMLKNKPPFQGSPLAEKLEKLLVDHVLVAHNAPFDVAMLESEGLEINQKIDTLRVARYLDSEAVIPEYNLQFLRYYLDLDVPDAKAHDAASDVKTLEALFNRLKAKLVETEGGEEKALEKMIEISSRPSLLRKFTFGKYKGELVEKVAKESPDYLEWLLAQKLSNNDEDEDWIYTLRHHLGLSHESTK